MTSPSPMARRWRPRRTAPRPAKSRFRQRAWASSARCPAMRTRACAATSWSPAVEQRRPAPAASLTAEQLRDADAARTAQFPAETEGRGNQILEPTIRADGIKEWELTASVIQWETEPGVVLEQAYAYNGTVPGPQLQAEVGDKVRVILHNELPQPDCHPLPRPARAEHDGRRPSHHAAGGDARRVVHLRVHRPGTLAAHMYHSHFMARSPGADGPARRVHRPPIRPARNEPDADLDYTMILNDGPLGFTLNGKGFPATEPIVASLGDRPSRCAT